MKIQIIGFPNTNWQPKTNGKIGSDEIIRVYLMCRLGATLEGK